MKLLKKAYKETTSCVFGKVMFFATLFSLSRLLLWFILYKISSYFPRFFYENYSKKVFQEITKPMKFLASLVEFSVGEMLLLAVITFVVLGLIFCIDRVPSLGFHT